MFICVQGPNRQILTLDSTVTFPASKLPFCGSRDTTSWINSSWYIEGTRQKGPDLSCVTMAGRAHFGSIPSTSSDNARNVIMQIMPYDVCVRNFYYSNPRDIKVMFLVNPRNKIFVGYFYVFANYFYSLWHGLIYQIQTACFDPTFTADARSYRSSLKIWDYTCFLFIKFIYF